MRVFLQILNNKVNAVLYSDKVPGVGPGLPSDFIEATNMRLPLGAGTWDEVLGYTYDSGNGSFTPPPPPPQTRREQLKANTTWTTQDRDDAIRELL